MASDELARQLVELRERLADMEAQLPEIEAALEPARQALESAQQRYDQVSQARMQARIALGETSTSSYEGQRERPHTPEEAEQARQAAQLATQAWTVAEEDLQAALVTYNTLSLQRSDLTMLCQGLADRIAQAEVELARERQREAKAERERHSVMRRIRDRLGVG